MGNVKGIPRNSGSGIANSVSWGTRECAPSVNRNMHSSAVPAPQRPKKGGISPRKPNLPPPHPPQKVSQGDKQSSKASQNKDLKPELQEDCKRLIEVGIQDSVKYYENMMKRILDAGGAYEDLQIESYHKAVAENVVKAFQDSFRPFLASCHPNLLTAMTEATTRIYSEVNAQLKVHITRHEMTMERTSTGIKQCSIAAESAFLEAIQEWDLRGKTREELIEKNEELKKVALAKFEETFKKTIKWNVSAVHYELNDRLNTIFSDLMSEWESCNSSV